MKNTNMLIKGIKMKAIKIYLKMKNKTQLSIEKIII